MLTLINSSELNLSVLHGRFTVSKLNGEITSCIGASSTNKVSSKPARCASRMIWDDFFFL